MLLELRKNFALGRLPGKRNRAAETRVTERGMVEKVEEFLRGVAEASQSALLLDYDGTLAPFSTERDQAHPYEGVSKILQQILDSGRTRLIIVSGRDAHEVSPLLKLKPMPEVWGAHGLQRLHPNGKCEMPEIPIHVAQALDDARRWLGYQGLEHLAEIKPGSIAVHWRSLSENAASELRSRILLGWFRMAERNSLKLLEFDGGVEMRMANLDKGDAVKTILGEVGPDVPVAYLGDDVTDERAFQALGNRGLTILVRPKPRRTAARIWMKPPADVLEFLSGWQRALETKLISRSATPAQ